MDIDEAATLAGRCNRALDPLHAMIYFAPESADRLTDVGLRPGRMCYFASRSAPMGAVGAGVVAATFFNFNPELVAAHIPRAWGLAEPETVVRARFSAADAALRRLLGGETESDTVAEAAELAAEATEGCFPEGRPLYAAHAGLEWPRAPHLVLWHAISLLREFRGDGHIAALTDEGMNGLNALVTHTATGQGFVESAAKASRGWSEEQWDEAVEHLRGVGILDGAGELTEQGHALRERVENATDRAAARPWERLGQQRGERLRELGKQLSRTVAAAGAFPDGVFAAGRA